MITSILPKMPELVAVVTFGLACWLVGVSWAMYRALTWADRIRAWANTADCSDEQTVRDPAPTFVEGT